MSVVHADLDDIVFEERNKDYGAYQMRSKYTRLLTRAALIAFLLFLFITGLPKIVSWLKPEPEMEMVDVMVPIEMELEDLPPPKEREEEVEPPPPPPPVNTPPPAARAQIEFRIIEPAPEEEVDPDETIKDMDELVEADTAMIGNQDRDGIADDGTGDPDWDNLLGSGDGEPQEVQPVDDDPDPNAFIIAEEEPRPVNMDDIRKLIGYPPMAKEAEIEGKVIVRVLVDKTGKYKKHIVLKDPHPILTKAVTGKLNKLQFTPGIQAGKPIKVWVTIPFDFKLLK